MTYTDEKLDEVIHAIRKASSSIIEVLERLEEDLRDWDSKEDME